MNGHNDNIIDLLDSEDDVDDNQDNNGAQDADADGSESTNTSWKDADFKEVADTEKNTNIKSSSQSHSSLFKSMLYTKRSDKKSIKFRTTYRSEPHADDVGETSEPPSLRINHGNIAPLPASQPSPQLSTPPRYGERLSNFITALPNRTLSAPSSAIEPNHRNSKLNNINPHISPIKYLSPVKRSFSGSSTIPSSPSAPAQFLCAICQNVLSRPVSLLSCSHAFCLECIESWAVQEEIKLLRTALKPAIVYGLTMDEYCSITPKQMNERCSVCIMDKQEEDELIRCSSCAVVVHQHCYGLPEEEMSQKKWLCDPCRMKVPKELRKCVLCATTEDKAMKIISGKCPDDFNSIPTNPSKSRWVHIACARWHDGVLIGSDRFSPITNVNAASKRFCLQCEFCETDGACVQCVFGKCVKAFHVPCAFRNGVKFEVRNISDDGEDQKYFIFCHQHREQSYLIKNPNDNPRIDRSEMFNGRGINHLLSTKPANSTSSFASPGSLSQESADYSSDSEEEDAPEMKNLLEKASEFLKRKKEKKHSRARQATLGAAKKKFNGACDVDIRCPVCRKVSNIRFSHKLLNQIREYSLSRKINAWKRSRHAETNGYSSEEVYDSEGYEDKPSTQIRKKRSFNETKDAEDDSISSPPIAKRKTKRSTTRKTTESDSE